MKITDIPLEQLKEAPWNSNRMEEDMVARLRQSVKRYGLVQNLVARPLGSGEYEVLSGNQRLKLLGESGHGTVPCVVVDLDDARARLLAQALNHIRGEDDLGLRAELLKKVLESIQESEVLSLLPETAESLKGLASMGHETIATYLQNWRQAQAARLKHLQFQLTAGQLEVVQEALARIVAHADQVHRDSPNIRGNALYLLCKFYLVRESK